MDIEQMKKDRTEALTKMGKAQRALHMLEGVIVYLNENIAKEEKDES